MKELGEETIKFPVNIHAVTNLSATGVAKTGGLWQCLLCDKKSGSIHQLIAMTCPAPRIYRITALED